jgi:hypothetical protein
MMYAFFWVIPRRLKFICGSGYFRAKPFPVKKPQHFSNLVILHTYLPMKMEQQGDPKRQHINFRHRGITQKEAYNTFIHI